MFCQTFDYYRESACALISQLYECGGVECGGVEIQSSSNSFRIGRIQVQTNRFHIENLASNKFLLQFVSVFCRQQFYTYMQTNWQDKVLIWIASRDFMLVKSGLLTAVDYKKFIGNRSRFDQSPNKRSDQKLTG
eukprot:TRINITY_DN990_c1_g1_i3.p4 TRINITY_DN990_c1_g1~~TRINITY_DN990_c1_g1_i3.p4  ORF type:complete len:134 (-),score=4.11 TRINITY_DN990_c1_g1_i3:288-689(-)